MYANKSYNLDPTPANCETYRTALNTYANKRVPTQGYATSTSLLYCFLIQEIVFYIFVLSQIKRKIIMKRITIHNSVKAPVQKVWDLWTTPEHIVKWNAASEDWHTTRAENNLKVGGEFSSRMEAKDGSFGFDFIGIYDVVDAPHRIAYTLDNGRKVEVDFKEVNGETSISQSFDPDSQNPAEQQQQGWQAILDNFKSYAEDLK